MIQILLTERAAASRVIDAPSTLAAASRVTDAPSTLAAASRVIDAPSTLAAASRVIDAPSTLAAVSRVIDAPSTLAAARKQRRLRGLSGQQRARGEVRLGSLNVGTMSEKGVEVVEMIESRRLEVCMYPGD